ncbi:ATP-binding protein [Pseudomonas sp. FEN]|uniref:ATP-binding protein n=1 Tax=Pseudomonas sp. FEN TaxID=2767468 RepID=UPI001748D3E1|nr:ATP-binding protein [Pseudomonas sp. FEN]CAD5204057.1 Sensory histidine kinase BaeS [Pseudomonas sp. FEN]
MRISLSSKVFLAVQALCTLTVCGMGVATYFSFSLGFLGYLNEQATDRLERAVPRFEQAYASHGDWSFIAGDPRQWLDLIRPENVSNSPPTTPRVIPISDLTGAFLRFSLFDAKHRYIIGYNDDNKADVVLRAIRQGDKTVGWLAMTPFESVSAVGDQRFRISQLHSSIFMMLACLLASAFIAWWVTQTLLRPIKRVAEATHRLAAGDYSVQLAVRTDDEVGQLARDFNRMADGLANNERRRRDFMADISHELRTPLAIMRGELEALEDGIRPVGPSAFRSLQTEISSLTKLVDDLFELSLAEVGGPSYRKEPVNLGALLGTAVEAFAPRFSERGLTLHFTLSEQSLYVTGDKGRLSQLIYNLLENSLRYTNSGGRTELSGCRKGKEVIIICEDSAPGVPEAQRARLFERFYRVEASRNRSSGGAGLGLAICRGIAEVHGGRLSARESTLGGLRLILRLPAQEEEK